MRPIRLVLEAFGPFAGRIDIDFESLANHGLFVVAGPTGTGKTTIFDAMAFALYGKLPGDRPIDSIRSQHAQPNVPTSVAFEFEMEGQRWKVSRSPAWSRPKQRGAG
ncbi:MAG: AAA family ATPase, partial [Alphaproteobacteria bacterium]